MRSTTTLFSAFALLLPLGFSSLNPSDPSTPYVKAVNSNAATTSAPVRHCQVPCGIYGDRMRIDMLMEDCDTIEKGMMMLAQFDKEESPSKNQIVRWVVNKEEHAQAIQDQVAAYWLAQRIKAPKDGKKDKYLSQLEMMHGITVAAMKCKQGIDVQQVANLRKLALQFSESYFKKDDLDHIRSHHGGGHK